MPTQTQISPPLFVSKSKLFRFNQILTISVVLFFFHFFFFFQKAYLNEKNTAAKAVSHTTTSRRLVFCKLLIPCVSWFLEWWWLKYEETVVETKRKVQRWPLQTSPPSHLTSQDCWGLADARIWPLFLHNLTFTQSVVHSWADSIPENSALSVS